MYDRELATKIDTKGTPKELSKDTHPHLTNSQVLRSSWPEDYQQLNEAGSRHLSPDSNYNFIVRTSSTCNINKTQI